MADAPTNTKDPAEKKPLTVLQRMAAAGAAVGSAEMTPEQKYHPRKVVDGLPQFTKREQEVWEAADNGSLKVMWQEWNRRCGDPNHHVPNAFKPLINAIRNLDRWGLIEWCPAVIGEDGKVTTPAQYKRAK